MNRLVPAVNGAAFAVLVAVASAAGPFALAAALLLAGVTLAVGWVALLSLPSPRGTTAVIALSSAVSVSLVAMTDAPPYLRWLPGVLAVLVLTEFAHQLLRKDMRPRLVESVTGGVLGIVVVALGSGWLAALHHDPDGGVLLVGATAALVTAVAAGMPWPQRVTGPAAVLGAVAFAALVGMLLPDERLLPSAALGLAVGVIGATFDRLLAHLPTAVRLPGSLATGTAPLLASGLVVYTLARFLA